MDKIQFSISSATIFRIVVVVLSLWFLYVVRDIIALLLVAIIITASLEPIITRACRLLRLPRPAVVVFVYVVFFTAMGLFISYIVPTLSEQVRQFGDNLSSLLTQLGATTLGALVGLDKIAAGEIGNLTGQLSGSLGDIFNRTKSVVSGLIGTVAVISMSFYMSLQKDGLREFLVSVTPKQHRKYVNSLVKRISESFGWWMAGQLVTMIFVGVLYFIALSLLGVPYAALLAILGGLLEIVPYLGPIMAVIPAALLGFAVSPAVGLGVIIAYSLINLVENHVLIPQIMNKAVGLNPVAVILALLIGAKTAGLVGVILAVPIAGALALFVKDVLEHKIR